MDYQKVFDMSVDFVHDYLKKNGLKSMVLGISGGLDSTVCAAICHEVEKKSDGDIKFFGYSLPSYTNSAMERENVKKTAKAFIVPENFKEVYISKSFHCIVSDMFGNMSFGNPNSEGNIKARIRMIYLYGMAGENRGLVIDTDNLSENYLGFYTKHGDQGDLAPIACLWKHEVYGLAKWLRDEYYKDDAEKVKALIGAIEVPPTDGNSLGSTDMDQIAPGHTYDDVDDIIMSYLKVKNKSQDEIKACMDGLNEKYDKNTVDRVIQRHLSTEFKRQGVQTNLKVRTC